MNQAGPTISKLDSSTTTMKRKAIRSLAEPEAKRARHLTPHDVPTNSQDSLASKFALVQQHISTLAKVEEGEPQLDEEEDVEKSLVVKLGLAPRLLVAFPLETTEEARQAHTAIRIPPRDQLPPYGSLGFLDLPLSLRAKIYQDVIQPSSPRQLLQEVLGIISPLQRLEWLFTCKQFLFEARPLAFSKVPFFVRPFNSQAISVHGNGHRIDDPKNKTPWQTSPAFLNKAMFRMGVDHNHFVLNKFRALKGNIGLVKHVCHSMPITGLTSYQEDLDWTPFGMDLACGSYSSKYGVRKLDLDKLTLVTNGFPLDHWNRTSKRCITEDLAAWILSSIVEHTSMKRLNILIMDRRYTEKVKDTKSPLAQREVGMDVRSLRAALDKMLQVIVERPWLTDVNGQHDWTVKWGLKGTIWCWECRARIGSRVVDVVVADVAEVEALGIDLS
ncbi:hypothetical protein FKW77_004168 [Venturia effusa]|uniref:Uncharacterized protein n=1 Tax=Venturia effusa TaxID=50376 RepID=A0A517L155_9PEZI|nr:hypothetical protein FKW77_004168 [Venturia effusa]